MAETNGIILGIDVGERRTGLAIANSEARLAQPYTTLLDTININQDIADIAEQQHVILLVIGLPLNTDARDTDQTLYVRRFAERLKQFTSVPIAFQDEANSSQRAEAELIRQKREFGKADIDAMAAAYILQDYLDQNMVAPA